MAVTTAQLLALAKEAADLTDVEDYVTDATWVSWMQAAVNELHRLVTNKFKATYYRTFDFTLAGSTYQQTLPENFWRLRGLTLDPDTLRRRRIRPYNFAEGDDYRWNGSDLICPRAFAADRRYNVLGSRLLQIEPQEHAAGSYRLYYVPKPTVLSLDVTSTFDIDASDTNTAVGGLLTFALANIAAISDMVGGSLTLNFDAPNVAFNGVYTIGQVPTSTSVVMTCPSFSSGITGPASGTASVTYADSGGASTELDEELEPFAEYVWLAPAIKSLTKEESYAQAKELKDQRNLIRADLTEALEQDQGGPQTIIDTDEGF